MADGRLVFATITLAITVGTIVSVVSAILLAKPTLFGHALGNYVFARYGTAPGDIYFNVPEIPTTLMWPDFETRAYYNGWFWNHHTDPLGFRNPPDREAQVLLLGDSFIYGHGVEMQDGVSEVLRERYGWDTYNLSQQGDCLYQSYVKLRLYLTELGPRAVLLFAFHNDASDLEFYRNTDAIDQAPELQRDDWNDLRRLIAERGLERGSNPWIRNLPGIRFWPGIWVALKERIGRSSRPDANHVLGSPLLDSERRARIQRYYNRILADLVDRTEAAGAELVVVNLVVHGGLGAHGRTMFRRLLETAVQRSGAWFFDTRDVFLDCSDCALEHDGHLSPKGHRMLAELVDQWLRRVLIQA